MILTALIIYYSICLALFVYQQKRLADLNDGDGFSQ